jgi:hypothetical protein
MLGLVVNIVVHPLFMSTVVVPLPAVPAQKSAQYILVGDSTITVFARLVPVVPIVPAIANLYILAFSNQYLTSENPAANVSHIRVTVTVFVA